MLQNPVLAFMGSISYEVYLYHLPIYRFYMWAKVCAGPAFCVRAHHLTCETKPTEALLPALPSKQTNGQTDKHKQTNRQTNNEKKGQTRFPFQRAAIRRSEAAVSAPDLQNVQLPGCEYSRTAAQPCAHQNVQVSVYTGYTGWEWNPVPMCSVFRGAPVCMPDDDDLLFI